MNLQFQSIIYCFHLATILDRNQRPRGQTEIELRKFRYWYIFGPSPLALGLIY